jgi:hypothetical protein
LTRFGISNASLGTAFLKRYSFVSVGKGAIQRRAFLLASLQQPVKSPFALHMQLQLWLDDRALDLDSAPAFISDLLPPKEYVYMNPVPDFPLTEEKCLKLIRPL